MGQIRYHKRLLQESFVEQIQSKKKIPKALKIEGIMLCSAPPKEIWNYR